MGAWLTCRIEPTRHLQTPMHHACHARNQLYFMDL